MTETSKTRIAIRTALVATIALTAVPAFAFVGKHSLAQKLRVDGARLGLGPLIELKADVVHSPHLSAARHVAFVTGH